MEVVNDGQRLPERPQRLVVVQVADVLADEGLAVHHQGDRVLQIGLLEVI